MSVLLLFFLLLFLSAVKLVVVSLMEIGGRACYLKKKKDDMPEPILLCEYKDDSRHYSANKLTEQINAQYERHRHDSITSR